VVKFAPRPKRKIGVNLLSGEAAERRPEQELAADEGPAEWAAFLKPNITITMVDDFTSYPADKVPDHVRPSHSNPNPLPSLVVRPGTDILCEHLLPGGIRSLYNPPLCNDAILHARLSFLTCK
jgi:hypothetical protein